MSSNNKTGHDRHGKRGRHKKGSSPEARYWEAELMQPERPAWMPKETYVELMRLREQA